MVQLVKVLAAWALTLLIYATIATALSRQRSWRASDLREGLLGIGLVVGLPTLVFALSVVWPIAALLRAVGQPWVFVLGAAALFGAAMRLLTAMVMPTDWKGASQAVVAFAALLGLVWGAIGVITAQVDPAG